MGKIVSHCRGIIVKFRRNDVRIIKKIAAKYGEIERNRVDAILNIITKLLAEKGMGVLEHMRNIGDMVHLFHFHLKFMPK